MGPTEIRRFAKACRLEGNRSSILGRITVAHGYILLLHVPTCPGFPRPGPQRHSGDAATFVKQSHSVMARQRLVYLVRWHIEHKVLINGSKTLAFPNKTNPAEAGFAVLNGPSATRRDQSSLESSSSRTGIGHGPYSTPGNGVTSVRSGPSSSMSTSSKPLKSSA